MFKVLLPFLYVLSTEYSVVFSGFLDTVLDMYNMIDWLSTGGVVAYTILGSPCLKTSERQGAPGPDPESATRGSFASGRKIQKNVNIDKFPIFTAKSRSKKKKIEIPDQIPCFHYSWLSPCSRGVVCMDSNLDDGFIRQPSACGAATVHSNRITHMIWGRNRLFLSWVRYILKFQSNGNCISLGKSGFGMPVVFDIEGK
jgi:hypothetical protein